MKFNPLPRLPEDGEIGMQEPDYLEKNKLNPQEIKKEILSYLSNPLINGIYKGQIREYISEFISGYVSEFISKEKLFYHKSKILEDKFKHIEDLKNDLDKLDSASKEEALGEITKIFCGRMEVYLDTKKIDPFNDVIFDENQKPYFIKNSLFQVFFESPENRILIKKTIDEVFNKNSKETQTAQQTGVVKQRVDEIEKRIREEERIREEGIRKKLTPGDVYEVEPPQASSRPPQASSRPPQAFSRPPQAFSGLLPQASSRPPQAFSGLLKASSGPPQAFSRPPQVPPLDLRPISGTSYGPPPLAPRVESRPTNHPQTPRVESRPTNHPQTPRPSMPTGVPFNLSGHRTNPLKTYPKPDGSHPHKGLPNTHPSEASARVLNDGLWL